MNVFRMICGCLPRLACQCLMPHAPVLPYDDRKHCTFISSSTPHQRPIDCATYPSSHHAYSKRALRAVEFLDPDSCRGAELRSQPPRSIRSIVDSSRSGTGKYSVHAYARVWVGWLR